MELVLRVHVSLRIKVKFVSVPNTGFCHIIEKRGKKNNFKNERRTAKAYALKYPYTEIPNFEMPIY